MKRKRILCCAAGVLFAAWCWAQPLHVRGVVYDGETGDGLPGVTVQVEGQDVCTITDARGLYLLTVADSRATIVYVLDNYNPFRIKASDRVKINVVMYPDFPSSYDVDVGYGTQRSGDITGAVSTVSAPRKTKQSYMISCVRYKKK